MGSPLEKRKNVAIFEYDFAKDGGAVGDITLRGGDIPANAIVDFGLVDVVTAVTSDGSATCALKLVDAADVLAATGKASFTLNATLATKQLKSAATAIKTTARKVPVMTVAVAALTAGKIRLVLEYTVSR